MTDPTAHAVGDAAAPVEYPDLTIRVLRVNPSTGEGTEVMPRTKIPPTDDPIQSREWPPCECPQCREQ